MNPINDICLSSMKMTILLVIHITRILIFEVDIDAGKCGNETRFINDYRGSAKAANVKYQVWPFFEFNHVLRG